MLLPRVSLEQQFYYLYLPVTGIIAVKYYTWLNHFFFKYMKVYLLNERSENTPTLFSPFCLSSLLLVLL
jgi:hypothetical protein